MHSRVWLLWQCSAVSRARSSQGAYPAAIAAAATAACYAFAVGERGFAHPWAGGPVPAPTPHTAAHGNNRLQVPVAGSADHKGHIARKNNNFAALHHASPYWGDSERAQPIARPRGVLKGSPVPVSALKHVEPPAWLPCNPFSLQPGMLKRRSQISATPYPPYLCQGDGGRAMAAT